MDSGQKQAAGGKGRPDYQLIRSGRRSVSLEVKPEGLVVRAPYLLPVWEIDAIVRKKQAWIEKRRAELARRADVEPLPQEALRELAARAKRVIPERVRHFAPLVGVGYGRIAIRCQRTRWGSCSAQGNLNFNCLLLLAPPEVLDSVVVHELCHRREMNHSARFYAEVQRVMPDYRKWEAWLKKNGPDLLARAPK